MTHRPLFALLLVVFGGAGCGVAVPELSPAEQRPGGDATNTLLSGNLAYSRPFENAERADADAFFSGNSFFTSPWVEGVSSTSARDGLGPLFNARACAGCHQRDGRGRPPEPGESVTGMLFRLSTGALDATGAPQALEHYGGQLQPLSVDEAMAEGEVAIAYDEETFTYPDGERATLLRPRYEVTLSGYGPEDSFAFSPRVAPAMIGMALLENIPADRLQSLADPDDDDGDGVSGRLQNVFSERLQRMAIGRFGWKAEKATVADQTAGAFAGDMGLTSPLSLVDDCTSSQAACLEAQSQTEPEVSERVLSRVIMYSSILAPPAREIWDTEELVAGRRRFYEVGCASCHVPSHVTGPAHAISAANNQRIWPYTDLLLHDMGDDLSDQRPTWSATGNEWRTPPLWGLHALEAVNGHNRLLHDGRARGVEEAILWHGGEGESAKEAFARLPQSERVSLVRFVESL